MDSNELDAAQIELVRVPLLLKYLLDSRDAGPYTFQTEAQLTDRYLDHMLGRNADE